MSYYQDAVASPLWASAAEGRALESDLNAIFQREGNLLWEGYLLGLTKADRREHCISSNPLACIACSKSEFCNATISVKKMYSTHKTFYIIPLYQ